MGEYAFSWHRCAHRCDNDGGRAAMLIIEHMAKEKFTPKFRLYLLGMTAGVVNAVIDLILSLKPSTVGVPLGSCFSAMAFSILPFRGLAPICVTKSSSCEKKPEYDTYTSKQPACDHVEPEGGMHAHLPCLLHPSLYLYHLHRTPHSESRRACFSPDGQRSSRYPPGHMKASSLSCLSQPLPMRGRVAKYEAPVAADSKTWTNRIPAPAWNLHHVPLHACSALASGSTCSSPR
jgi:hypothetical protein